MSILDSFDGESWSRRILGELERDARLRYFALALESAKRVDERSEIL